jgi:hypothetical protein
LRFQNYYITKKSTIYISPKPDKYHLARVYFRLFKHYLYTQVFPSLTLLTILKPNLMKRPLKTLCLFSLLLLTVVAGGCGKNGKMKVTFVNQTSLPVNMYVSGDMCTNENLVLDLGMRKDEFTLHNTRCQEEFEVAVNNQVLVRKALKWKEGAKDIMVVYNGSDLLVSE